MLLLSFTKKSRSRGVETEKSFEFVVERPFALSRTTKVSVNFL